MAFALRQLTRDDAAAFHALRMELLSLHPESFGTAATEHAAQGLETSAERLATEAVVGGFVEGELVGIASLMRQPRMKERHKGMLRGMYVRRSSRGSGLSDAIVEWILDRARADGIEQVHLTVVADNARARRLYDRWGFTVYGIEPRAFKMDGRYYDQALMVRLFDGDT
jgi:RimJ/RimL family protein N-acetyltransferase